MQRNLHLVFQVIFLFDTILMIYEYKLLWEEKEGEHEF